MSWDLMAAAEAGLVATSVMAAFLYMAFFMMPRQMPMNLFYMLGTMMTTKKVPAYVVGATTHAGLGIVYALIHTGVYRAFELESNLVVWGVLFGAVHWVVVAMGFGILGMMHPLTRSGGMEVTGLFVMRLPMITLVGFLMLHLVYGMVLGALYEVWA